MDWFGVFTSTENEDDDGHPSEYEDSVGKRSMMVSTVIRPYKRISSQNLMRNNTC